MSNLRDFSSEAWNQLQTVVHTDAGFFEGIKYFFSDIPHLDTYAGSMSDYYKTIVNKHSMDKEQLDNIFKDVAACDEQFQSDLSYSESKLEALNSCIEKLKNVFDNVNGSYVFEKADFADTCLLDIKTSITQYYFELFYKNGELNTDAISDVMSMDPSEVSEAQYAALTLVLFNMTTTDENGNLIIDTDLLEYFTNCSYLESNGMQYSNDVGPSDAKVWNYELSPVYLMVYVNFMNTISGFYSINTDIYKK